MTLLAAIVSAWKQLQEQVETEVGIPFDHEFTFQFHLAWKLARILNFSQSLNVRFEVPCGKDADGESIRLDLLFWDHPNEKIAVELKAPLRSEDGMNSAMTQFRMRFYRDIHRLRHLVEVKHLGIRTGVFLAVVNEKGYGLERNQRINTVYRTYHGVRLSPGTVIPATAGSNGYPHEMKMPGHEISWNWSCHVRSGDIVFAEGRKHFWLEPIVVSKA